MLSQLNDTLFRMDSFPLEWLEEGSFLENREDHKFMGTIGLLPALLDRCSGNFSILDIDSKRHFPYLTHYFDNDEKLFYQQQHQGKGHRLKIRVREYPESHSSFLEIKKRDNKGRTTKIRKSLENGFSSLTEHASFLQDHIGLPVPELKPQLSISYQRLTLLHKNRKEKLTLDVKISFSDNHTCRTYSNLLIAEIKREKRSPMEALPILKNIGFKEGGLSKYCLGMISLNPEMKRNNFNTIYRKLLKTNEPTISS